MWDTGFMVWRIGDILDVEAQFDWVRDAGFEAVSFHAGAGDPGHWRGIDPAATDRTERRRLRERLAQFTMCEVHAPFSAEITLEEPPVALEQLAPVIEFAGEVGAAIVTIHAQAPDQSIESDNTLWQEALDKLDALAGEAGVVVGLELMRGFEWLMQSHWARLGITLDIGHMYLDGGAGYRPYGSIGGLVRASGDSLVHIHVHDYDGRHDHIELGSGHIDFDDFLRGVAEVNYRGAFCLELNPDRVSPEGIRRSREWLRKKCAALGLG